MAVTMTRQLRTELVREAGKYMREYPGVEAFEVGEHVAGIMLGDEARYGVEGVPAIDISDYAYGVAHFITGGRF